MGIKITAQSVVRALCIITVAITLFFDYLYVEKVLSYWFLFNDNPELVKLATVGFVGYASINLLVAFGVKWSWT